MVRTAPIGVIDSGLGGLSVLREIRAALPAEDLVYLADHERFPYGNRDAREVRQRLHALVASLVDEGARAIVLACNTATAAAADALRAAHDVPIIGMEPAVKPAARATRTGVVGVLGTGGTLRSARFAALLQRYADDLEVITRPAPELVEAVEHGDPDHRARLVRRAVEPLLARGADVIVLGCTHFPFLRLEIEAACGGDVTLIDTGPAVARELRRRLHETERPPAGRDPGTTRIWTTGDALIVQARLERMWPGAPAPEHRPVVAVTG